MWTQVAAPSPPGPGTAAAWCMTSPSPTWPSAGSSSGNTGLSLVNTHTIILFSHLSILLIFSSHWSILLILFSHLSIVSILACHWSILLKLAPHWLILHRNGFLSVRVWFPAARGVLTSSDQEVIIMCKPPARPSVTTR